MSINKVYVCKRTVIKLVLVLVLMIFTGSSKTAASFEDVDVGAKASSLAGAYISQSDDLSGMFYNPAGLIQIDRTEVLASYQKLYWGLSDGSNIGDHLIGLSKPFSFGTFGLAWNGLALSDLYNEGMLKLSYARKIKGKYSGGIGLSYLRIGYGETEYTKINPVFDSGYTKTGMGVDLGFMYEDPILNIGLSILNLNEPDMGLKYEDRVMRRIGLGASLKQRILNLNVNLLFIDSEYRVKTGIEAWIFKRSLACRGGLSLGSSSYRNAALGMGYLTEQYELAYSFVYPLSGISGIYGNHQLSFTYRFGESREEDDDFTWKDLLEFARKEEAEEAKKEEVEEEEEKEEEEEEQVTQEDIAMATAFIINARNEFSNGDYKDGLETVKKARAILKDDQEIIEMARRGRNIVNITGDIKGTGKMDRLVRKSLSAYMQGNGKTSINSIRYATQLYGENRLVSQVRRVVETEFPEIAESEKLVPGITLINQKLQQSLESIYAGGYVEAVALCKEVLELEPANALALMRMGSAYWAMGHSDSAKDAWREALKYDPNNEQIREFLKMEVKASDKKGRTSQQKIVEPVKKKADLKTRQEYENGVSYYNRVKRYGANESTLKSIVLRMVDKFKETDIDISFLLQELKNYK